jgi:hypothetical protein
MEHPEERKEGKIVAREDSKGKIPFNRRNKIW